MCAFNVLRTFVWTIAQNDWHLLDHIWIALVVDSSLCCVSFSPFFFFRKKNNTFFHSLNWSNVKVFKCRTIFGIWMWRWKKKDVQLKREREIENNYYSQIGIIFRITFLFSSSSFRSFHSNAKWDEENWKWIELDYKDSCNQHSFWFCFCCSVGPSNKENENRWKSIAWIIIFWYQSVDRSLFLSFFCFKSNL